MKSLVTDCSYMMTPGGPKNRLFRVANRNYGHHVRSCAIRSSSNVCDTNELPKVPRIDCLFGIGSW